MKINKLLTKFIIENKINYINCVVNIHQFKFICNKFDWLGKRCVLYNLDISRRQA